jgi:hypothetical protein
MQLVRVLLPSSALSTSLVWGIPQIPCVSDESCLYPVNLLIKIGCRCHRTSFDLVDSRAWPGTLHRVSHNPPAVSPALRDRIYVFWGLRTV